MDLASIPIRCFSAMASWISCDRAATWYSKPPPFPNRLRQGQDSRLAFSMMFFAVPGNPRICKEASSAAFRYSLIIVSKPELRCLCLFDVFAVVGEQGQYTGQGFDGLIDTAAVFVPFRQ